MDILARFETKMTKGKDTECWDWTSYKYWNGYGMFWDGKKQVRAHRWSHEHFVGPIPDGLVIDHLCRNRLCVNPKHLEPVTQRENLLRGDTIPAIHAAKTHCKRGHEFTEKNTFINLSKRYCRECSKLHNRRKRDNKRLPVEAYA